MNAYLKQITDEYLRTVYEDEEIAEPTTAVENSATDYMAGINKVLTNPTLFGLKDDE